MFLNLIEMILNLVLLHRHGIELVGISSDGDPKLMGAMRYHMNHHLTIVTQDYTHIGTKLRNRLNKKQVLAMVTAKVSIDHLKSLVKTVQKSIHGLTLNDCSPLDRMNFKSFQKIIDKRVIEALKNNIPKSEATIQYLIICDDVTSSFLNHKVP